VEFWISCGRIGQAGLGDTSDLPALIDLCGKTEVPAGKSAQVFQTAFFPHERVGDEAVRILYRVVASGLGGKNGGIGTPNDRSGSVDDGVAWLAADKALRPAERTQIHKLVMMVLGRLFLRRRPGDYHQGASQGYRNEPPHSS